MDVVWIGLANLVLVVHLAYVAFIPLGGFLTWRRPRAVWLHLGAIAVAVVSITIGFDCPLTTWEQSFRDRGGQRPYRGGFVDHYFKGRVYPHGDDWAVWLVFGLCIVGSYAFLLLGRHRAVTPQRARSSPQVGSRSVGRSR